MTFSTAASPLEIHEHGNPKGDATMLPSLEVDFWPLFSLSGSRHPKRMAVLAQKSCSFFVAPCLGIAKFVGTPFGELLFQTKPTYISIPGGCRNRRWSTACTSLRPARVPTCGGAYRYLNSKLNARRSRCCSCA